MLQEQNAQLTNLLQVWNKSGYRLADQIASLQECSPFLYDCIDFSRIDKSLLSSYIKAMTSYETDFDGEKFGGRGDMYRHAQQNVSVRSRGIHHIFNLISPQFDIKKLAPAFTVLDVLGGDGTLTRALMEFIPSMSMPSILTSDLSRSMVEAAMTCNLPVIQQPAQHLLLKEASFDAVIIAYGSHHIPQNQRIEVCKEAFRVLKPGGRIVLHDFEEGSPVAKWFNEVVHTYSLTGHDFQHFTQQEMQWLLVEAGFTAVDVSYMYDPFLIRSDLPRQVQRLLGEYLLNMYGLVKLENLNTGQALWEITYDLARKCFQYDYTLLGLNENFGVPQVQITQNGNYSYAEMPRVALAGFALKPC